MLPIRRLAASLIFCLGCPLAAADQAPGLIGEYFSDSNDYPGATKAAPFFLRIDKMVNFSAVDGEFYHTKLAVHFSVRWSGMLKITQAGQYNLSTESDDGSRLTIDGKQVVDNGGSHGMETRGGPVELTVGEHPLLLEFVQGEGQAGCRLLWTPPGGTQAPIPGASLVHDAEAEKKITWDPVTWKKKAVQTGSGSGKYATMDHGPFVTGTFVQPSNLCTAKGIAIYLNPEHTSLALFDPELNRMAFAGHDAEIGYPAGRDGIEGQPTVIGEQICEATNSTGWAKPGSEDFTDARVGHLGNLPRDWTYYHGLYLNGNQVVLSYSVGAAEVLEVPGAIKSGDTDALTRSFTITGNRQPMTMLVAEQTGATVSTPNGLGLIDDGDDVTIAGVVGGGTFHGADGRLTLTIPAATAAVELVVWHGPKSGLAPFKSMLAGLKVPSDAHALTKGGKGRWGEALETVGVLGKETGAYVVDTIPVPYVNPAKSYMRLTGHDFFKDGRAAVSTMDGDVWIVSGITPGLEKITWKRFATGLFQPLGLRIVDDTIYVTCRDRLMRLKDLNGDGEADFYESFNSDCPVTKHYHEFALDLETDKDGNFYYCKGSNLSNDPHGATSEAQGCMLKISKDGSTLTRYCSGLREPNGMGGGDGYPLLNSDNQGNWTPVDRINLVREGGFYGFLGAPHRDPIPTTYDPPICWTPYNLDNSPGGLAFDPTTKWGPFKDIPIGLSYGKSCMFTVLMETVDGGIPQGGIVFFPLNFASGTMRARFSKIDNQLYVSGMRGWQTNAVQEGNFQRVRYTGKPVYMPTSLHIHPDAVEIGFPIALDAATAADTANFAVSQWNYQWTANYGSEDYSVSDPSRHGPNGNPAAHDKVEVSSITLSPDKKSITLKIPGLKPVMQMEVKFKIAAEDGEAINLELYNTINKIPAK